MPCDTRPNMDEAQIEEQRRAQERLRALLAAGVVTVTIGRNGALAFKGWQESERGGLSDLCAYRKLAAANAPELRRAIARAEAVSGLKLDQRALAAGVHSHDGGSTWHGGH